MSSTNRGGQRIENDAYYTPPWCVHRLLEVAELPGGIWVEPCVGSGSIMHAVNAVRNDVTWETNDLVPSQYAQTVGDARNYKYNVKAMVTITNPPFNFAQEILEQALLYPPIPVFLQRLNWCAGPRAELFRKLLPSVYVLPNRPSFCQSVSCSKKKQGCNFAVIIPVDATPPKFCPLCNSKTKVTKTDSIEYAWFVFNGRGTFQVLEDTPAKERGTTCA